MTIGNGQIGGQKPRYATDASNNTVLVGPDGENMRYKQSEPLPVLMRLADTPIAQLQQYAPVYAVGSKTKLYIVASAGTLAGYSFVYDWATGALSASAAQVCGGAIAAGTVNGLWASSTHLFVGMKLSGGTYARIYRSALSDGLTWTQVFDYDDLSNPNTGGPYQLKQFAEASDGTLMLASYTGGVTQPDHYSKGLLRSTDAGVTWTDVEDQLESRPDRHIHFVVWDKYRSCFWAGGGDLGNYSYVNVSEDFGATWVAVPGSWQTTGIIPTPDGIYTLSDRVAAGITEAGIWFMRGTTVADIKKSAATCAYNPRDDALLQFPSPTQSGFSWWGWYEEETGLIWAPYNGTTVAYAGGTDYYCPLAASANGVDWGAISTDNGTSVSDFVRGEFSSRPSDYFDWDGWHWAPGSGVGAYAWRVHGANQALLVDNINGYKNGIGSAARPFKTIPSIMRDRLYPRADYFEAQHTFKLIANYADPLHQSGDNIIIDRNGFAFTGAAVGALTVDEGFESGVDAPPTNWAATNSGTGALTWNSTAQKHGGSYAVKCAITVSGNARMQRNLTASANGSTITLEGWFYVDMAAFAAGRIHLIKTHGAIEVALNGGTAPYLSIRNDGGTLPIGGALNQILFPLQTWNKITLRIKRDYRAAYPYYGAIELWQNDKKIISAIGGVLSSDRASETYALFGAMDLSTVTATTVYVDDVKIVNDSLPSQSAGLVVAGKACLLV